MQNLLLESQSTKSSFFNYQDTLYGMDNSQFIQSYCSQTLLQQYRTFKPNTNFIVKETLPKDYFPQLCSFFSKDKPHNLSNSVECKCPCIKTEDNYCELIMKWIEEEYFWKTDRQFFKIYENYLSKKIDENEERELSIKLQEKTKILGLKVPPQQFRILLQIISNYKKHTIYYNKYTNLIANSDIFIWVVLGIWYHLGQNDHQKKSIIFWATDIIMENFQDLTPLTLKNQHAKCMKRFQHYYSKWIAVLTSKGVNLSAIIWEWMNQMMFGYVGIESIAFLLDCFKKSGWDFIYKVMLSYFEHRACHIKKNIGFLTGEIQADELYKLLLDGKEEWPLVFCTASSFVYQQ